MNNYTLYFYLRNQLETMLRYKINDQMHWQPLRKLDNRLNTWLTTQSWFNFQDEMQNQLLKEIKK